MAAASIPNPIHKVLSTFQNCGVRALLMGGQACVLYGGSEFSRDVDFVVFADPANLDRIQKGLALLQAELIAVPPFDVDYLRRGHAVHFRCRHPAVAGLRVDLMTTMRGVDEFERLWERRTTIDVEEGIRYELLSLPDLVKAKKTQRDKDWPMIRRLIEADYAIHFTSPSSSNLRLWFREARTPSLLIELAKAYPELCESISHERWALRSAIAADEDALVAALNAEADQEREADRRYWTPLRQELENLRRRR